jgi:glycosyltransferase involved in cell wall biosynthesis
MELSTVLIVKNELKNLEILLPSLNMFSDEIVIADTGSKDNTEKFLNSLPFADKIVFEKIKWKNDFAYARNSSIKLASKEFIFWIDADDRIEDKEAEKIFKLKNKFEKDKIFALKLFNQSDKTLSYQLRIFPNVKDIKFKYPVHEQLHFNQKNFKIFFEDIVIIHTGYVDRDLLKRKQLRNLSILMKTGAKDLYTFIQIAESYKMLSEYSKAEEFFLKALNYKEKEDNKELIGFLHIELFKVSLLLGKHDKAQEYLKEAEKYSFFFPIADYFTAREYFKLKNYKKAAIYFQFFLKKHQSKKYLNPVPAKTEESAKFFLAKSLFFTGDLKEAEKLIKELLKISPENRAYKYFQKNFKKH